MIKTRRRLQAPVKTRAYKNTSQVGKGTESRSCLKAWRKLKVQGLTFCRGTRHNFYLDNECPYSFFDIVKMSTSSRGHWPAVQTFSLSAQFARENANRKGYYFYSPQSSTVIKSKMAATTTLRTGTRFRPPKIRLHCRLTVLRRVSVGFR